MGMFFSTHPVIRLCYLFLIRRKKKDRWPWLLVYNRSYAYSFFLAASDFRDLSKRHFFIVCRWFSTSPTQVNGSLRLAEIINWPQISIRAGLDKQTVSFQRGILPLLRVGALLNVDSETKVIHSTYLQSSLSRVQWAPTQSVYFFSSKIPY